MKYKPFGVKKKQNNYLSDCNWTRTHNDLVRKRTKSAWPVWLNG